MDLEQREKCIMLCIPSRVGKGFWFLAGEGRESPKHQWSALTWKDRGKHQPQGDSYIEASLQARESCRINSYAATAITLTKEHNKY